MQEELFDFVEKVLEEHFEVTKEQMFYERGKNFRHYARIRFTLFYILHCEYGVSTIKIHRHYNIKLWNVFYACRKIREFLEYNKAIREDYALIKEELKEKGGL